MPIKKAAKKYMRITKSKTEKNRMIKGAFRSAVKKTEESITKGDVKIALENFKKTVKALDKATQKNVLHRNTAARKKSRLNKRIKLLGEKK